MHQSTFGICIGPSDQVKLHENLYFLDQAELGDIITCTLDLDTSQSIQFFRNGLPIEKKFLVSPGPNRCFYPALTLFDGQKAELNFGQTRFRHLEVLETGEFLPLQVYRACFVKNYYGFAADLVCLLKVLVSENRLSLVSLQTVMGLLGPLLHDSFVFSSLFVGLVEQLSGEQSLRLMERLTYVQEGKESAYLVGALMHQVIGKTRLKVGLHETGGLLDILDLF